MSASSGEAITEKVRMLSEARQRQVAKLVEQLLKEEQAENVGRPISAIFVELGARIPAEEWRKLPSDGAEQHDHYLYGIPRRNGD